MHSQAKLSISHACFKYSIIRRFTNHWQECFFVEILTDLNGILKLNIRWRERSPLIPRGLFHDIDQAWLYGTSKIESLVIHVKQHASQMINLLTGTKNRELFKSARLSMDTIYRLLMNSVGLCCCLLNGFVCFPMRQPLSAVIPFVLFC